jgi:hypothetical protein
MRWYTNGIGLAATLISALAGGPAAASARDEARAVLETMPLVFVANDGQLDRRVAYVLQGTDKTFFFTPSGVTLLLHRSGRRP